MSRHRKGEGMGNRAGGAQTHRRQVLQALGALGMASFIPGIGKAGERQAFAAVEALARELVDTQVVPGVVVAVGREEGEPQFISHGTLGFSSPAKVDQNTLWRIYSMTKPVAGMAAMALIAQGRMALDQPIADFMPEFGAMKVLADPKAGPAGIAATKTAKNPITVRHLLTHTSGIGAGIPMVGGPLTEAYTAIGLKRGVLQADGSPDVPGTVTSLAEFARRLATVPLEAEPGTHWRYSYGLDLIGRIVEIVSGQSFNAFLKQTFFDPLGMTSTGFRVPAQDHVRLVDNFAPDYAAGGGKTILVDPGATSKFLQKPTYLSGGGGLVSSARDYDRFLAMLMGGGIFQGTTVLPPHAVTLGMSNLLPEGTDMGGYFFAGSGDGFGAGGRVILSGNDKGAYGWMGAAGTLGVVNRDRQLRVTGMLNRMDNMALPEQLPDAVNRDLTAGS